MLISYQWVYTLSWKILDIKIHYYVIFERWIVNVVIYSWMPNQFKTFGSYKYVSKLKAHIILLLFNFEYKRSTSILIQDNINELKIISKIELEPIWALRIDG